MAKERYGNGYKGGAHTPRKMYTTFRGFADHSARSLKPVHKRKGARRAMRNTIDQTVRCVLRMALRNQAWRVLSLSHIRCGTIGTPRVFLPIIHSRNEQKYRRSPAIRYPAAVLRASVGQTGGRCNDGAQDRQP